MTLLGPCHSLATGNSNHSSRTESVNQLCVTLINAVVSPGRPRAHVFNYHLSIYCFYAPVYGTDYRQ